MKLRKVKNDAEARLAMSADTDGRPTVEFTTKDANFVAVRIGQLHIGPSQYGNGIELTQETPFDSTARYRVTAKAPKGFADQVTYFEDYGEAVAKRDSFGDGIETVLDSGVKVLVDGDGNVIREEGIDAPGHVQF